MKLKKKLLNLHHLSPQEVVELILPQELPLVRGMKVPQNLNCLPLLEVVELVLPIELKTNDITKKCDLIQVCLFSQILFCRYENLRVHTNSVFETFSAVHTYPIVSGNFLICSSAQFFCRRES